MKRMLALILALITLCGTACSGGSLQITVTEAEETVTALPGTEAETEAEPARVLAGHLTERPNYVLHEGATADEMRQMAIKAMREAMSVNWYPEKAAKYEYTSPNNGETIEFNLTPDETYAGIPYSSSYTGLFQFLEYYDFETGMVSVPNDEAYTTLIGNDCAGGAWWALAACLPSFDPASNGYARQSSNVVAVGPYTLPSLDEEKSSQTICSMNGEQTMYESYACLKPADTVTTGFNPGLQGHYMMLLEAAHVVRNADGTINGKESTITIQDQMRGHRQTTAQYLKEENGEMIHYSGKWGTEHSFEYLWNNAYLPVTCKEFIGESPYIMPWVSLDREVATVDELSEATLQSQFMLCAFHIRLVDEDGRAAFSRSKTTTYSDERAGTMKNFPLKALNLSGVMLARSSGLKGDYTLEIDCVDATGTTHEVARVPVTLS